MILVESKSLFQLDARDGEVIFSKLGQSSTTHSREPIKLKVGPDKLCIIKAVGDELMISPLRSSVRVWGEDVVRHACEKAVKRLSRVEDGPPVLDLDDVELPDFSFD
jgi:hypothetical protein